MVIHLTFIGNTKGVIDRNHLIIRDWLEGCLMNKFVIILLIIKVISYYINGWFDLFDGDKALDWNDSTSHDTKYIIVPFIF